MYRSDCLMLEGVSYVPPGRWFVMSLLYESMVSHGVLSLAIYGFPNPMHVIHRVEVESVMKRLCVMF